MIAALINGSPKPAGSTSALLLRDLKKQLDKTVQTVSVDLHIPHVSPEQREVLRDADILVISCPLYVDGIPGHLLGCLMELENMEWKTDSVPVYAMINGGFYEGHQARLALRLVENWAHKAGLVWGGGLGIGGGGALAALSAVQPGQGPKSHINEAIKELAITIGRKYRQDNQYTGVAVPRFFYKYAAELGWRNQIRANGKTPEDLSDRPMANRDNL